MPWVESILDHETARQESHFRKERAKIGQACTNQKREHSFAFESLLLQEPSRWLLCQSLGHTVVFV